MRNLSGYMHIEVLVIVGTEWLYTLRVDDRVYHHIHDWPTQAESSEHDSSDESVVLRQEGECALDGHDVGYAAEESKPYILTLQHEVQTGALRGGEHGCHPTAIAD